VIIIGVGQGGNLRFSAEAKDYLDVRAFEVVLQRTPQAIQAFNRSRAHKIALMHVTCRSMAEVAAGANAPCLFCDSFACGSNCWCYGAGSHDLEFAMRTGASGCWRAGGSPLGEGHC